MRILKLSLIIVLSLLLNCSSDDDSSSPVNVDDPIVGTWNLKFQQVAGQTLNDTDCNQQSYITWNSDLTSERVVYLDDGQGGDCNLFSTNNGTWAIIAEDENEFGDENYRYTDSETGQSVEEEIIFIDANNIRIDYGFADFFYEKN
ncbi:MAG: lipocalin family protein [Psychroserpens sp.]|uniref:lipocalin family protein n=1 Tax=Psychroserpens sp. TaxID=2020870 RepID=UPI003C9E40E9